MRNICRVTAAVVLSLMFVACDLFLFPVRGRLNILDPKNELVRYDKFLAPVVDGWVEEGSAANADRFNQAFLYVGVNPPTLQPPPQNAWVLLRFDFSEFPMYAEYAELLLNCSSFTGSDDVQIFRITQPWEPKEVTAAHAVDPKFRDSPVDPSPVLSIDRVGYYSWSGDPMTNLIRLMIEEGEHHGFLLEAQYAGFEFHSSENSVNPPQLHIVGWDNPD